MPRIWRASVFTLACVFSATLWAASPPVGFAASEAKFGVGSSFADGQVTLFDGDSVRSLYLSTRVHLKDGTKYVLGIDSESTVRRDGLELRFGSVDLANAGRPTRVTVGSLEVLAEKPSTKATVYTTGAGEASVVVASGEVKVSRGSKFAIVKAGEPVSLKPGPNGTIQSSSKDALAEISRVQSEQVAVLLDAAKAYTCLASPAEGVLRSFSNLSSRLVANEAARNAIQAKIDSGMATQSDLQNLASLNNGLRSLGQASAGLSQDLDGAIYQFHHPGPPQPFPSPHKTHGHIDDLPHHGQHGHTVTFPGDAGHHQTPPHHPGVSAERGETTTP